jgi:hypothetical protein
MAKKIQTFAPINQISSAGWLNPIQDLIVGLKTATSNNALASQADGIDARIWSHAAGALATGTLVQLDDSIDWRDRVVFGCYVDAAAATNMVGGATDYFFATGANTMRFFHGYTGTGALSNVATGAAVSNGNPPVAGTGAGGTSWSVELNASSDLFLYTQANGRLYMYNATGGNQFPLVFVLGLGDAGLR